MEVLGDFNSWLTFLSSLCYHCYTQQAGCSDREKGCIERHFVTCEVPRRCGMGSNPRYSLDLSGVLDNLA